MSVVDSDSDLECTQDSPKRPKLDDDGCSVQELVEAAWQIIEERARQLKVPKKGKCLRFQPLLEKLEEVTYAEKFRQPREIQLEWDKLLTGLKSIIKAASQSPTSQPKSIAQLLQIADGTTGGLYTTYLTGTAADRFTSFLEKHIQLDNWKTLTSCSQQTMTTTSTSSTTAPTVTDHAAAGSSTLYDHFSPSPSGGEDLLAKLITAVPIQKKTGLTRSSITILSGGSQESFTYEAEPLGRLLEMKLYSTTDICDVQPIDRWRHALLRVNMPYSQTSRIGNLLRMLQEAILTELKTLQAKGIELQRSSTHLPRSKC